MFGDTRLRTSTDNIGLARAANGLDLVRIGAPLRTEMAAWRYGSALQRRWREHWRVRVVENAPLVMTVTGVTTAFSIGIGSPLVGIACSGVGMALSLATSRAATRDVRARVVLPDGQVTDMRALTRSGVSMRVETTSDGGWALRLRHRHESHLAVPADAERTLRSVLAYQNAGGGSDRTVATAVEHLVSSDDTSAFINRTARAAHRSGLVEIASYPAEVLLAFEMALHDESERRALDGELAALADEWELAEEVAKIADDMFLPDAVRARFDMLSARQRGGGT